MSELRDLELKNGTVVPARCLSVRYSRSGGPGGQHVNRTETKADLRLDLVAAREVLGESGCARVVAAWPNRLDADGNLQVVCSEHRSQARNLDTALDRMQDMLDSALAPRKRRRRTRPTRGSVERRLESKRQRGETKRQRRPPQE